MDLRQKGPPPMPETDTFLQARDLPRALALLTRLPAPGADGNRTAASAWAWPLVGALLALIAGAAAWLALALGLPAGAAAGLALGAMIVMTGGLHEDGLADCADGFWGGATAERRLEIMKDSRIGSYGVLALILILGLKWVLLTELIAGGALWVALLVPAMGSRAAMVGVMASLGFAREDGLARHVGRPTPRIAAAATILAIGTALLMIGATALSVAIIIAVTALAMARLAQSKIGGQTGDVLGATQGLTELAALATLAAMLPA